MSLKEYNGSEIGNYKRQRDDGVINKKHAQGKPETGHKWKPVAVEDIHYHIPGNIHGAKTEANYSKAEIVYLAQVLGVKKNSGHTDALAKLAYDNDGKKNPENEEELLPFK
jgi:hypothetical protein